MLWAPLASGGRHLYLDTCPLLESVCNSIDVRLLVQFEVAELVARFATLIENNSIVNAIGVSLDEYRYLLTAPAVVGTAVVVASEFARDTGRVIIYSWQHCRYRPRGNVAGRSHQRLLPQRSDVGTQTCKKPSFCPFSMVWRSCRETM